MDELTIGKDGMLCKLAGVFSTIGENRNDYPARESSFRHAFSSPIFKEKFEQGGMIGRLDHTNHNETENPDDETLLKEAAIIIKNIPEIRDDGSIYGEVYVLNTPNGRLAYVLAKSGMSLGISYRGGIDSELYAAGREDEAWDKFEIEAFDLVYMPAYEEARLKLVEDYVDDSPKQAQRKKASLARNIMRVAAGAKQQKELLRQVAVVANLDAKKIEEANKELDASNPQYVGKDVKEKAKKIARGDGENINPKHIAPAQEGNITMYAHDEETDDKEDVLTDKKVDVLNKENSEDTIVAVKPLKEMVENIHEGKKASMSVSEATQKLEEGAEEIAEQMVEEAIEKKKKRGNTRKMSDEVTGSRVDVMPYSVRAVNMYIDEYRDDYSSEREGTIWDEIYSETKNKNIADHVIEELSQMRAAKSAGLEMGMAAGEEGDTKEGELKNGDVTTQDEKGKLEALLSKLKQKEKDWEALVEEYRTYHDWDSVDSFGETLYSIRQDIKNIEEKLNGTRNAGFVGVASNDDEESDIVLVDETEIENGSDGNSEDSNDEEGEGKEESQTPEEKLLAEIKTLTDKIATLESKVDELTDALDTRNSENDALAASYKRLKKTTASLVDKQKDMLAKNAKYEQWRNEYRELLAQTKKIHAAAKMRMKHENDDLKEVIAQLESDRSVQDRSMKVQASALEKAEKEKRMLASARSGALGKLAIRALADVYGINAEKLLERKDGIKTRSDLDSVIAKLQKGTVKKQPMAASYGVNISGEVVSDGQYAIPAEIAETLALYDEY